MNFVPIGDVFFTVDLADMLRTNKRKTLPNSYSKENLNTATENVKSGWMTIYRAGTRYKIPIAA